jgi:hypothetical protein
MIAATDLPGLNRTKLAYLSYLQGWYLSTGKPFEGRMVVAAAAMGIGLRHMFFVQAELREAGYVANSYKRLEVSRERGFNVYGAIRGLAGPALALLDRIQAAQRLKKAVRETVIRDAAKREAAQDRKAEGRRQKRAAASAAHEESHPAAEKARPERTHAAPSYPSQPVEHPPAALLALVAPRRPAPS